MENPLQYFKQYIIDKNVKICQEKKTIDKDAIDKEDVQKQLVLISEFHSKISGYQQGLSKLLNYNMGKTVEEHKVDIKKVGRSLRNIQDKQWSDMLERAQKCINLIYSSDYYGLLKRSMDRREVCLGDTFFDNIWREEKLCVNSIKDCCYDMVELDCVYLLNKLRKKGIILHYRELVEFYCLQENLDENSYYYILSMLSFPEEFMKCWRRYRIETNEMTEKDFSAKIKRAMKKDRDSLI